MKEKIGLLGKKNYIIGTVIIIVLTLLFNYISLSKISLKLRSTDVILNIGDDWEDPGVTCYKGNQDLSKEVKVDSELNLNKKGTYIVKYKIKSLLLSKSVKRKVTVLDKGIDSDISFKLNGGSYNYLLKGNKYIEPGYTVIDNIDGNISSSVQILGTVNNSISGSYKLIYTVKNSRGVIKKLTRYVEVYTFDFEASTKYSEHVKENEIIINIRDKNYDYIILPNGSKSISREINYRVTSNDVYIFKMYDLKGGSFNYYIEIDNIDDEPPTGTCNYILYDNGGKITVIGNDDDEIIGYKYTYGGTETELLTENTFDVNTLDDTANVAIYDKANNSTIVQCDIIDNSTKTARSYTLKDYTWSNNHYQYWVYTPNDNAKRTKYPLVVNLHGDHIVRTNPDYINRYGFTKLVKEGQDFPFYIISPYCTHFTNYCSRGLAFYGEGGLHSAVVDMINYMIKNYNIDTDRIILIGEGTGGDGVYFMSSIYKNIFSCAIVDNANGFSYNEKLGYVKLVNPKDLTNIPLWVFQAKENEKITYSPEDGSEVEIKLPYSFYEEAEKYVNRIKSAGGNIRFTPIDGSGENNGTIYTNQELINWMLSQRRNK